MKLTKTEYGFVEYNKFVKICEFPHRYNKDGLLGAHENINIFMKHWLTNSNRREHINYTFEPDKSIPIRADLYNLYFGFKIELENEITDYDDCDMKYV